MPMRFKKKRADEEEVCACEEAERSLSDGGGTMRFLVEQEELCVLIDKLAAAVEDLMRKHCLVLTLPGSESTFRNEVSDMEHNIDSMARGLRMKLQDFGVTIKTERGTSNFSAALRIHRNQYTLLSQKLTGVIEGYRQCQDNFREKCKRRLQRNLEITGRTVCDEELEKMLDDGDTNVFSQDIIVEMRKVKQELADTRDRNVEIEKLEQSVNELRDLFVDMNLLVNEQGESLSIAESNVNQASTQLETGIVNLKKARKFRNKFRRRLLCFGSIIGVCILIAVIIIVVVVLVQ